MQAPACSYINLGCTNDPKCSARLTGKPCWLLVTTACCERQDKSRCVYCSIYREYLEADPANYVRRPMVSNEPESFAEACREFYRGTGRRLSDSVVIEEGAADHVCEDGTVIPSVPDEQ